MTGFRWLNLRWMREHSGRTVLSVVGVAAGVALAVALLGILSSVQASVRDLTAITGDRSLVVPAPTRAGLEPRLVREAATLEAVEAAAPLIRARVGVGDQTPLLVGVDPLTPPGPPQALDDLLTEIAAAVPDTAPTRGGLLIGGILADRLDVGAGDRVAVYSPAAGTQPALVAGVLRDGRLARVNGGNVVFTTLADAQQLTGRPDRIDAVVAVARPGDDPAAVADQLQATLGLPALTSTAMLDRARRAVSPVVQPLLLMASMALVVGGFLVFNTMNMAALERRRDLAVLRTLGGSGRRLMRHAMTEAALVGAAGTALGLAAGAAAAAAVIDQIPPVFADVIGTSIRFALAPWVLASAAAAGVGVSLLAAAIPAVAILRVDPITSLRADGSPNEPAHRWVEPGWAAAGVALLASAALAAAVGGADYLPALLFMTGVLVAAYGFAGAITTAQAALVNRLGGAGRLAAAALHRSPRRVWATTVAIVATVTIAVAVAGLVDNVRETGRDRTGTLRGDALYLGTSRGAQLPPVGLPVGWVAQLAERDEVAAVATASYELTHLSGHLVQLLGVAGPATIPQFHLAAPDARAQVLDGRGVIITRQLSRNLDLQTGDTLTLPSPAGPRRLPVLDIVDAFSVSPDGTIAISAELLTTWYGPSSIDTIEVHPHPDGDLNRLHTLINQMSAELPVPLHTLTGDDLVGDVIASMDELAQVMAAILAIVAVVAVIALLNTLTASVIDRQREIAVLRAVGASHRQITTSVVAEAAVIAATGGILGAAAGSALHRLAVTVMQQASPYPMDYAVVPAAIATALILAAITATIGAVLPARRATRTPIPAVLAYDS